MEAISEKVNHLIKKLANENNFSLNDVDLQTSLVSLGFNSLTYIKLVIAIESEYNIEFDDDYLNINQLISPEDMVTYIKTKLS